MAAFKALKKERKLSKLPWLILSQLSKHIQKSHAKPTTHRNSHSQKSISELMSHLPKLAGGPKPIAIKFRSANLDASDAQVRVGMLEKDRCKEERKTKKLREKNWYLTCDFSNLRICYLPRVFHQCKNKRELEML